MAKNEDGEFELVLGNNQLLSVFFLVVLLLAVCFIGGYMVGRSTAPLLTASNPAAPVSTIEEEPRIEVSQAPESRSISAPVSTTPQVQEPEEPKAAPPKVEARAETKSKPEPPVSSSKERLPPLSSQPVSGRVYLQLSATEKDKAEAMADLVRRANMAAIAAPIPDRPNLYRVLVGPLPDSAVAETRTKLKASGFPGEEAIRRTF